MKGITFLEDDFLVISEGKKNLLEDIKRVLLTIPGERVNSDFGSYLKYYLFEPSNKVINELPNVLKTDLERWIPTIEVLDNKIEINDHTALLSFTVLDSQLGTAFDYDLSIQF